MSKLPYPRTVKEAASALDVLIPDWYKKVELYKLNMCECHLCIIGQIFNIPKESDASDRFFEHVSNLFDTGSMFYNQISDCTPFGAYCSEKEWEEEIKMRKTNCGSVEPQ